MEQESKNLIFFLLLLLYCKEHWTNLIVNAFIYWCAFNPIYFADLKLWIGNGSDKRLYTLTRTHISISIDRTFFSSSSCNNRVISVHHDLNGIFWKKYYSSTELSERAGGRADGCNSRMSILSRKYEMKRVYWLNNRE